MRGFGTEFDDQEFIVLFGRADKMNGIRVIPVHKSLAKSTLRFWISPLTRVQFAQIEAWDVAVYFQTLISSPPK